MGRPHDEVPTVWREHESPRYRAIRRPRLHAPPCRRWQARVQARRTTAATAKRRVNDDEDDRPARKSKSRKNDEDLDDRPARTAKREKRRLDDDDEPPKKKKSKLPLVLGILGCVLLLGCGGCGVVGYFFWKDTKPETNEKVVAENIDKLTVGMTQSQVEAILGAGKKLTSEEFSKMTQDNIDLTLQYINSEHRKYWTAWVDKGLVHRWRMARPTCCRLQQSTESGGKLKGLSYQIPLAGTPQRDHHTRSFRFRVIPPRMTTQFVSVSRASRLGLSLTRSAQGRSVIPKIEPKTFAPGDSKETAIRIKVPELLANPKSTSGNG